MIAALLAVSLLAGDAPPVAACDASRVKVTAMPAIPTPWTDLTDVFAGDAGGRIAVLSLAGTKIAGSVHDPARNRWTRITSKGAPVLKGESYGQPTPIGGRLLMQPTFAPVPMLFDPAANRWLDVHAGAPPFDPDPVVVPLAREWLVFPRTDDGVRFDDGRKLDLSTGRWSKLPSAGAPATRDSASVVACGGQLFVWGGTNGTTVPDPHPKSPYATNTVVYANRADGSLFDLGARVWKPIPAEGAPTARAGALAECLGGAVFVLGGSAPVSLDDGSQLLDGARYDLAKRSWTPVPASDEMDGMNGIAAGELYVAGTRLVYESNQNGDPLRVFDSTTLGWSTLPDPPVEKLEPAKMLDDGHAFFLNPPWQGAPPTVAVVDIATGEWCVYPIEKDAGLFAPRPFEVRGYTAQAASGGKLFVWGVSGEEASHCPPGVPCGVATIPKRYFDPSGAIVEGLVPR